MSIAFLYTNFIAAFCENVIFKKSFQTLQGCAKLPISYHQWITCHFNYWHTLTLLFYVCIGLHSEIVETNFVVSRFSDIRKETTSILVVPTRNDQERPETTYTSSFLCKCASLASSNYCYTLLAQIAINFILTT